MRIESSRMPAERPWPAAFHFGSAHVIMHGNTAFVAAFGRSAIGVPAREAMVDLPSEAFELMDLVLKGGRPLARRIRTAAGERRLVVAARRDPDTGETYGVATHLRPVDAGAPSR